MTGDGYAMAYRAGAELVNLEFIQIGLSSLKTSLACSGSMMRAIPRIVNDLDEEFLPRYFPEGTGEFAVLDVVFDKGASWPVSLENPSHRIDVAVAKEVAQGRKVFLDYGLNPSGFDARRLQMKMDEWYRAKGIAPVKGPEGSPLERLRAINPQAVEWLVLHGVDLLAGERVEIAPAIQHFQGGVRIRERAQATLRGLFAAGECAGGQHGANRPGGNALLDGQVFGRIAGDEAAAFARRRPFRGAQSILFTCSRLGRLGHRRLRGAIPATLARDRVQRVMYDAAGVVRTQGGLASGLAELERVELQGIAPDDKGLAYALETNNLLTVGTLVLRAARMRGESRGPHLVFEKPDDFEPIARSDAQWGKYIVVRRRGGRAWLAPTKPVIASKQETRMGTDQRATGTDGRLENGRGTGEGQ
jgi:succinate dehydrogenase / fumarate reductase flavoprotein subunit